jgi:hypothetical protein
MASTGGPAEVAEVVVVVVVVVVEGRSALSTAAEPGECPGDEEAEITWLPFRPLRRKRAEKLLGSIAIGRLTRRCRQHWDAQVVRRPLPRSSSGGGIWRRSRRRMVWCNDANRRNRRARQLGWAYGYRCPGEDIFGAFSCPERTCWTVIRSRYCTGVTSIRWTFARLNTQGRSLLLRKKKNEANQPRSVALGRGSGYCTLFFLFLFLFLALLSGGKLQGGAF